MIAAGSGVKTYNQPRTEKKAKINLVSQHYGGQLMIMIVQDPSQTKE